MNYEEKYKQALSRATFYNNELLTENQRKILLDIFPELKEDEDERIRKAIHIYLDWLDGRKDYQPKGVYTIRDMIDWVIKQDKKISADRVIAWLVANICDYEYYVKRFKQDFGL